MIDTDISYKVNFVYEPHKSWKEFSTLEEAKEYVEDVLDLDPDEVVNYDFDEDFVKPHVHRGYFRPHELGLP